MRKNEFIDVMKNVASEFGKVVVKEIVKPTGTYMGLTINKVNVPTPIVNLDALYNRYINAELNIGECCDIAKDILSRKPDGEFNIEDIKNWDRAKDKLYLRLVNSAPEGTLYREVEDMFLVPYIQVTSDDSATVKVEEPLLELWKVTSEEVFEQAENNQEIIRPLNLTTIADAVGLPTPFDIYIVSTKSGVNGASAIFYEGVFEDLYDRLGEFYLLPSSIHEMIAVPRAGVTSIADLKEMVTCINAADVEERDRLTNSVYTYDVESRQLRKVG